MVNYGFDVDINGFFVENLEPIPNFLVKTGLGIRGHLMDRIYRERIASVVRLYNLMF